MNAGELRAALRAFDGAALAVIASKGLVRRAERDVAAGLLRYHGFAGAHARIAADGETVTLGAGGPAAASCTCPAQEICRHIIAATLFAARPVERESPAADDPASLPPDPLGEIGALSSAAIEAYAGGAALRRALDLIGRLDAPPIVRSDGAALAIALSAELPEIVWLTGRGLHGIVSKAPAARRKIVHTAAILAVRRAHGIVETFVQSPARTAVEAEAVDVGFLTEVEHALRACLRAGLATAAPAYEDRLATLARSSRVEALPRLASLLRALATGIAERRDRRRIVEPDAMLFGFAETYALLTALRSAAIGTRPADPERFALLRGGPDKPVELGALRAIGVGATVWATAAGARGVTGYFFAPQAQRTFTATIARAAGADPAFRPESAYADEPLWGAGPLARIGHAELEFRGAAATSGGRLSLARGVRATARDPGDVVAASRHWPIAFDRWDALARHVRTAAAGTLSTASERGYFAIFHPTQSAPPFSDPLAQELVWPLCDAAGTWLAVSVPDAAERGAVARDLAGFGTGARPACVALLVTRDGHRFRFTPIAAVRAGAERDGFRSFGIDAAPPATGDDPLASLATRALGIFAGTPPVFSPAVSDGDATQRALDDATNALVALADLGGSVQASQAHDLRVHAATLRSGGFDALGTLVERAATPLDGDAALLVAAHAIARARAITARLPLLERVR